MNISYISTSTIPSNAANSIHVMKMCHALSANGHNVTLITPKKESQFNHEAVFNFYGVDSIFDIKRIPYYKLKGKTFIYAFMASIKGLFIRNDIIYTRDILIAFIMAVIMRRKVVCEIHQNIYDSGSLITLLFKSLLKTNNLIKIVVITDALKNFLIKKLNANDDLFFVAPDGADEIKVNKETTITINNNYNFRIGYAGHLYKGRGIDLIIKLAEHCKWAEFHIVGGRIEDIDYWKNQTKGINNIVFHGFVPPSNVGNYLLSFDFLLAPYQKNVSVSSSNSITTEQWMSPLKVFEYLSAKKPIICSDIAVLREILINEYNCILCPPDKFESWLKALERLRDDKKLCREVSSNAYKDLTSKYTWGKRAKRIINSMNLSN